MDGSFAPAKKGATQSEKPSGVRGRSGWWWSTARVFLWETTFTLHPRRPTQDGRTLRRYKRRWIVERTFPWLGNFRRLAVRYDRSLTVYRGFFHIACFMIVLRRVLK